MQIVSKLHLENETISLDDRHFKDCVLSHCVLEYSGKEVTLERTEFLGCRVKLTEAAGRTLGLLQCLGYLEDTPGIWCPTSEEQTEQTARLN